jgi:hypothetical protein
MKYYIVVGMRKIAGIQIYVKNVSSGHRHTERN